MTIREQQRAGEWYAARGDSQMINELYQCEQACYEINQIPPSRRDERNERIRQLFGKAGSALNVNTPFHCDFGKNIEVGNYFFANFNLTILDENRVIFGHHVYIGPNCSFYTAIHPLDVERRNADIQKALPIHVGDNVWIGGNVTVLQGERPMAAQNKSIGQFNHRGGVGSHARHTRWGVSGRQSCPCYQENRGWG